MKLHQFQGELKMREVLGGGGDGDGMGFAVLGVGETRDRKGKSNLNYQWGNSQCQWSLSSEHC